MLVKANTGSVQKAFASASMDPLPYGIFFVLLTIAAVIAVLAGGAALVGIAGSFGMMDAIGMGVGAVGAVGMPAGFKWGAQATLDNASTYSHRATKAFQAMNPVRQSMALEVVEKIYALEGQYNASKTDQMKRALDKRINMLEELVKQDAIETAKELEHDETDTYVMQQVLEEISIKRQVEADVEAAKQKVLEEAKKAERERKALSAGPYAKNTPETRKRIKAAGW